MTTAGRFVDATLGKAQCQTCGAIQKVYERRLADTDFYEKAYTYYSRPGSEKFDQVRYEALANWIVSAVPGLSPHRILDIGCGRGWTISALREKLPDAGFFVGLEPTLDAVALAQASGLDVRQGRLGGPELQGEKFDLIYSNNVLQHTTDPVAFLEAQILLLADGGTIVLSCPDGSVPSVELMMADQNFSFAPRHLAAVCAKAGLSVEKWLPCPGGPLRHEQLVVLKRLQDPTNSVRANFPQDMAEPSAFIRYLDAWNSVDDFFCREISGKRRVFNFGGGLWSYVLAAYCPQYWKTVKHCLVDGFSGVCIDKQVIPTDQVELGPDDIVILGTNPYAQAHLIQRFASQGIRAVSWNHLIPD